MIGFKFLTGNFNDEKNAKNVSHVSVFTVKNIETKS